MIVSPSQPAEMAEAHRRARLRHRRKTAETPASSLRARNVESILSLGSTEFVEFRGRAYGVPPVPWKVGQALNDARLAAIDALEILRFDSTDRDATAAYYPAIRRIPSLLWANCYTTGRIARILKRTPFLRYLLRNPFDDASDGELLEYADFFLARRMRSGVLSLSPTPATNPARRTS
jgi:hypothetical protein